jgi:hypothetical protein
MQNAECRMKKGGWGEGRRKKEECRKAAKAT